jgi:chromatin assembly factor 1 subunit B
LYKLRAADSMRHRTKNLAIDTGNADIELAPMPGAQDEAGGKQTEGSPVFKLDYRIVYAVATQDSVIVYDTQESMPLCIVSNLHYTTFTDLTWSPDGNTLIMTSTDGFCSALTFEPGELGEPYVQHNAAFRPPLAPAASLSSPDVFPSPASTPVASEPVALTPVVSLVPPVASVGGGPSLPTDTPPETPGHNDKRISFTAPLASRPDAPPAAASSASSAASDDKEPPAKKQRRITPTLLSQKD